MRYTPEFDPLGIRNSTSTVQSPYLASVNRSVPGWMLIRSDPPPWSTSLAGSFWSTAALPTTHLPLSERLAFQLSMFLPLNGESARARAGSTRATTNAAVREKAIDELRDVEGGRPKNQWPQKGTKRHKK